MEIGGDGGEGWKLRTKVEIGEQCGSWERRIIEVVVKVGLRGNVKIEEKGGY